MSHEQAEKSPVCLRYFFACALRAPDEKLDALSYEKTWNLSVRRTFSLAEQFCEQFNYKEAYDAMRAKLRGPVP